MAELPFEGSYAHDVWTSLVEFGENLVNVSNQRNARTNLGINVGIYLHYILRIPSHVRFLFHQDYLFFYLCTYL